MARNFYKKDGRYYYADDNQPILDLAELQTASNAGGQEVAYDNQGARDFYKKDGAYYYVDNDQQILNLAELQEANRAGGKDVGKAYEDAMGGNQDIQNLANGGSSLEDIQNALSTGDWSNIVDWDGKPFDSATQEEARVKAEADNKLYYDALQSKETADAESALAKDQASYQDYLINAGQAFESDKTTLDQNAANQGVLFSGSRVQKEKNMQRAYEQDQARELRDTTSNIGNTARDFQYKYGNKNATGLNNYYKLGSNTFNTNKATGGVGSGGLSSVYNPSAYAYQGSRNTERSANTQTRTAKYLQNRGNKLLASGYNNQL